MARISRHRRALVAAALATLAGLALAPATAEDESPRTDLYDRPVLAVDPGMHVGAVRSQAVDADGRFAVTGGSDRTVRIWSVAGGKLLRTIWVPAGPENVGVVDAVAISRDGSTIAAGGSTERLEGAHPIYIFDRESGNLVQRIHDDSPGLAGFLTFSPDGRYLAAMHGNGGLRIFDGRNSWSETFRDDSFGDASYGAAFAQDGRLAATSYDGRIRLYRYSVAGHQPNFRLSEFIRAPSGERPEGAAFSPDGGRLAVGYEDASTVDILDGRTLQRVRGRSPSSVKPVAGSGLSKVAWSADGETLYATGGAVDGKARQLLFGWDRRGLGVERRTPECGPDDAPAGVSPLPGGRILVATAAPCLSLMDVRGEPIWTIGVATLSFREDENVLKVSPDGKVVDFVHRGAAGLALRFDTRSLKFSSAPPDDAKTFAPRHEGIAVERRLNGGGPGLDGRPLPLERYDSARSLAIASDSKRFFLGTNFGVTAFNADGVRKWRKNTRDTVWAVNATEDGRIVVAAFGDGSIRWLRADDGRELMALQVFPNKADWALWTPDGFYEATPGAQDALKWVVDHGADQTAATLPVSAIAKQHRPDALPLVLDKLEPTLALGVADVADARRAVQSVVGSAKPPGAVLNLLAIGIDHFGAQAGDVNLGYAVQDAEAFAKTIAESQKLLYAEIRSQFLPDESATRESVLGALDKMAEHMRADFSDQTLAIILYSTHGVVIDGKFYLVPYGFNITSRKTMEDSALSSEEFAKKIEALAQYGRVLLLVDACYSGALRDVVDMENVSVLTSSANEDELSLEDPAWRHGAFTKAFLDALAGAADPERLGVIRMSTLIDSMNSELLALTHGRQHLGLHVNFGGDLLFVAGQ
jgi:WD40 repeat protein